MNITAAELKELGADVWRFKTVRGALLWWDERDHARCAVPSQAMEWGSIQRSAEERARDVATWAAILMALADVAHAFRLVEWHRSYRNEESLTVDWGFPNVYTMRKVMGVTERTLRVRMDERRLLEANGG